MEKMVEKKVLQHFADRQWCLYLYVEWQILLFIFGEIIYLTFRRSKFYAFEREVATLKFMNKLSKRTKLSTNQMPVIYCKSGKN